MGAFAVFTPLLPLILFCSLDGLPQVDRGVDNEHEGDGTGMLILSYVQRLFSYSVFNRSFYPMVPA